MDHMTKDISSIDLAEAINNARFVAEEVAALTLHQSDCVHRVIGEVFRLDENNLKLKKYIAQLESGTDAKVALANNAADERIARELLAVTSERANLVKELTLANTNGFGHPMNNRIVSIISRLAQGGGKS